MLILRTLWHLVAPGDAVDYTQMLFFNYLTSFFVMGYGGILAHIAGVGSVAHSPSLLRRGIRRAFSLILNALFGLFLFGLATQSMPFDRAVLWALSWVPPLILAKRGEPLLEIVSISGFAYAASIFIGLPLYAINSAIGPFSTPTYQYHLNTVLDSTEPVTDGSDMLFFIIFCSMFIFQQSANLAFTLWPSLGKKFFEHDA